MRRRVIIAILIIILLALVLLLRPRAEVVEVAEVRRGDLSIELFTTGIAESELADIAPRIVAPVSQILVAENQAVTANQPLAVLDREELVAQGDEARAALTTAQQQLAQAEAAVRSAASQAAAAVSRADAGLRAARARLADVQTGARPQEIESARAAVTQARAQAERAQADFQRAQTLFQRGAISAQDLDTARAAAQVATAQVQAAEEQLALVQEGARSGEIQVAQADVQAAEAALAEARAGQQAVEVRRREAAAAQGQVQRARAAVEAAEARLEFATVRSPFAGLVARRHLEVGEIANPQTPIFTLAQLDPVWVTAEVDEDDLAALRVGQRVTITSGGYPGRRGEGTVIRMSPIAEPRAIGLARARIVRARIDVEFSEFPMRPGMEVDIIGQAVVARNVILVPNDAVVRLGDTATVYVVELDRLYAREVEVGLSSFQFTEVTSGLTAGEIVATTRPTDPQEGQLVRVAEAGQ